MSLGSFFVRRFTQLVPRCRGVASRSRLFWSFFSSLFWASANSCALRALGASERFRASSRRPGLLPLALSSRVLSAGEAVSAIASSTLPQFLSTLGQSLLFVHQCVPVSRYVFVAPACLSREIVRFSFASSVSLKLVQLFFFVSSLFLGLRRRAAVT